VYILFLSGHVREGVGNYVSCTAGSSTDNDRNLIVQVSFHVVDGFEPAFHEYQNNRDSAARFCE